MLLLLARDRGLVELAVEHGLETRHFRDAVTSRIYEALLATDEGELDLDEEAAEMWAALLSDDSEVVHPAEAFEETVRRLVHRARMARLAHIDRELELADEEQARRLLVEKEQIARELRGAGVPLSFLRRYSETTPA